MKWLLLIFVLVSITFASQLDTIICQQCKNIGLKSIVYPIDDAICEDPSHGYFCVYDSLGIWHRRLCKQLFECSHGHRFYHNVKEVQ
jgi:hypothetical protein